MDLSSNTEGACRSQGVYAAQYGKMHVSQLGGGEGLTGDLAGDGVPDSMAKL